MLSILVRYNWQQFSIVTSEIAGHDDFKQAVRDKVAEMKSQQKFRYTKYTNTFIFITKRHSPVFYLDCFSTNISTELWCFECNHLYFLLLQSCLILKNARKKKEKIAAWVVIENWCFPLIPNLIILKNKKGHTTTCPSVDDMLHNL